MTMMKFNNAVTTSASFDDDSTDKRGTKRPASDIDTMAMAMYGGGTMADSDGDVKMGNNQASSISISGISTGGNNVSGVIDDSSDDGLYTMLPIHGNHKRAVSCVSFAPTINRFSGGSSDGGGGGAPIVCASASADGSVRLWDITNYCNGTITRDNILQHHSSARASSANVENETNEAPENSDGDASNNNNNNNNNNTSSSSSSCSSTLIQPMAHITGHSRGINDLAWSPRTPNLLATASDDKTLRIWDVTRSNDGAAGAGSGGDNEQNAMGNGIAGQPSTGTGGGSGGGSGNGDLMNHTTDNVSDALVEFKGHSNFCFSVKFSPQGNLLVSGSFDETVKVWDVRSGECVSTLPAHSDPVTGVDFNRDGTCIVSSSHDGLMRIWDVATNECLKTIYAEKNPPVTFVKYSPNGKYVLSGMLDGKLRLWNVMGRTNTDNVAKATAEVNGTSTLISTTPGVGSLNIGLSSSQGRGGQCTKTYEGHVNSKYCIFSAFSVANPQRQSIVTGSEDGSIHIYDLQTRNVRQILKNGHSDACLAVAAHDKKEIFASGGMSNDRTVRFWMPKDQLS